MKHKMISLAEYAERHGLARTTVQQKCARGNLPGAEKIGRNWCIPEDAPYVDYRVTSGKYVKRRDKKPTNDE